MEWKTYIEPVRHTRAKVTEANALDFCREFSTTLSFMEKKVPPHPTGRATVMIVTGLNGGPFSTPSEVPFWVEMRGDRPYPCGTPKDSWGVEA